MIGTANGRIALLALAIAIAASAAATSLFSGRHAGRIACDPIPGQTSEPLDAALTLEIIGGNATYAREVLQPDSRLPLGVIERGSGTVTPEGDIALKGGASGPTWRYEASYEGKLEGKAARLEGQQVWHFQGKTPHLRPCTVSMRLSQ